MPVTINGSTGISGVDGSAGTPALIGSDADTGIFVAAGQVSASINGTAGNVPLVSGTAQASTSGTSIDFTGIPSWAKRVTVMFNGVSLSGTSSLLVQIGSGSFLTSGYLSGSYGTNNSGLTSTAGFVMVMAGAGISSVGSLQIINVSGNTWVSNHQAYLITTTASIVGGGNVTLSGTLDRVRITTVNGTDTLDAGSINIMYE